jgi:hypothetical protein
VIDQPSWKPDLRDLLALAGVALISVGAWMIFRPAAAIVAGLFLLMLARPWAS